MNYESLVERLISNKYDLGTEGGRQAAYRACVAYATTHFADTLHYPMFLAVAADRLRVFDAEANPSLEG